jgi:hypothetical protein
MSIGFVSFQWFFWNHNLSVSYIPEIVSDHHGLTIAFYGLCQLLFNLGPETITIFRARPRSNAKIAGCIILSIPMIAGAVKYPFLETKIPASREKMAFAVT